MGTCSVLGVGEHELNELNEYFLAPTDFTENTGFLWFGANTDGKDNTDGHLLGAWGRGTRIERIFFSSHRFHGEHRFSLVWGEHGW